MVSLDFLFSVNIFHFRIVSDWWSFFFFWLLACLVIFVASWT